MIVLGKSRDWIEKEKQEKEQEKRAAAEGERRAEEIYVITLRFADTLERAEEGRRGEDVSDEEWARLQRVTGSPRVSSPPAGWSAIRRTDRLIMEVAEELNRWSIDYEILTP